MFRITPYRNNYDLFNVFDNFWGNGEMPVNTFKTDIREEADKYVLEAEMPGFSKEDVKIDIEDDYLTLSAERKFEKEDSKSGYIRRERSYGSFKRSFNIEDADADNITAKYDNGVLILNLPKRGEKTPKTRRLEIQ